MAFYSCKDYRPRYAGWRRFVLLTVALNGFCSVLCPGDAFAAGFTASQAINFQSTGNTIDSFNSTNSLYSTSGFYDASKAQDHGDLTVLSSNTNSIILGNARVKGSVHTGPAGGVVIGPNGTVGDKAFVESGSYPGTIQPGHFQDNATFTIAAAALPATGGMLWMPPVPGSYVVGGVTYKYVLNASRPWKLSSLDGGVYVNGTGVKLWVSSSVNLGASSEIRIPSGSSFSLYVSAASATIGGGGVINETGLATNFQYYGLPSNTSLSLSGNGAFVGQIYAPQAAVTIGGGGNNTYDFIGCIISSSVTVSGHFNFHFDESSELYPPVFSIQPQTRSVMSGQDVTFFAQAESASPLTYQWRFNGTNILGATNTDLTITNAAPLHGGIYSVIVSNVYGSQASSNAALVVVAPPTIGAQPASQRVLIGSNATFTVVAEGLGPFGYQWSRNGSEIPGATDATWTIAAAQLSDGGAYIAVVTNSSGAATSSVAILTVVDPATPFVDNFGERMSFTGTSLTVTGALTGATMETGEPTYNDNGCNYDPVASVWWSWTAVESSTVTIIAIVDYAAFTTADRVFEVFAGTDLTNLTELACNLFQPPANRYLSFAATAGTTYHIRAVGLPFGPFALKLIATNPPVILQQPTACTVSSYGSASFFVAAAGLPKPSFQWRLNGMPLVGQTAPALLVRNVLAERAGDYSVTVSNAGGVVESASATLGLVVTDPEPRLAAFPLASSNQFGFTMTAEPGRCYRFEVATNLNPWLDPGPIGYHCAHAPNRTNLFAAPTYGAERLFVRALMDLDAEACTAQLKLLDAAGKLFVIEFRKTATSLATEWDLARYFAGGALVCPSGGSYMIYEPAVTLPTCSRYGCCGHGGLPLTCP